MNTLKTWILTVLIAFAVLAIFSYDDGMEDQAISASVEREAIAHAKLERKAALHARIESANRMLSLGAMK